MRLLFLRKNSVFSDKYIMAPPSDTGFPKETYIYTHTQLQGVACFYSACNADPMAQNNLSRFPPLYFSFCLPPRQNLPPWSRLLSPPPTLCVASPPPSGSPPLPAAAGPPQPLPVDAVPSPCGRRGDSVGQGAVGGEVASGGVVR